MTDVKKEILVVDDNLSSLKQIAQILSGRYEFSLMRSGEEALRHCLLGERPDLVLLDVDMPHMNGFETLTRLRAVQGMEHVPVLFLSAFIDSQTEIMALESGARDFITKPVDEAILLHRLDLHLQLGQFENDLEKTRKDLENNIVLSFADLVESKDSNTGGHVLRTSHYIDLMGQAILSRGLFPEDLDAGRLELMIKAAPFHDIGKIGISDVLLLKPGPLEPDEYEEVKKHTVLGANFLRNVHRRLPAEAYLEYAAAMAEGHHERWDGDGYPYGLARHEIPFCCRLMAVVNVYDACLTPRIYREPLSHFEAIRVISEGRGTQFDPAVVDVFETMSGIFQAFNVVQTRLPRASKRLFPRRHPDASGRVPDGLTAGPG
ncbi:MAG: response regulator [Deltaproteobacteria bacterium]|jgi:putative two-component system response regulator|nr:response regulator [Deltaproteobacteria bacterium]